MSVRRACIVSDHQNRFEVQKIYHLHCYKGRQLSITLEVKEVLYLLMYDLLFHPELNLPLVFYLLILILMHLELFQSLIPKAAL